MIYFLIIKKTIVFFYNNIKRIIVQKITMTFYIFLKIINAKDIHFSKDEIHHIDEDCDLHKKNDVEIKDDKEKLL